MKTQIKFTLKFVFSFFLFCNYIDSAAQFKNRNVRAFGYQIGGFSLVGFEYEVRVHNYFGLNLGVGIKGFTGGVKVHPSKKKNSPFLLLSFKDGGFGLIGTTGAECGGRWVFSKLSDAGLIFQLGIAKIQYINSDFEDHLFKGRRPAESIITFGVGFSW